MTGITPAGIRYPDGSTKAKQLGAELEQMAEDLDTYVTQQASTTDLGLATKIRDDASQTRDALEDIMPPLVEDAIEGNPVVVNAASAAAVNAVGSALDNSPRIPQHADGPGIVAAIVDSTGASTWLAANDVDGGPTPAAVDLARPYFNLPDTLSIPGVSAAVVDAAGYRSWLEVNDTDGGPTPLSIGLLRDALAGNTLTAIVCDGDSMTYGGLPTGESWPDMLTAATGIPTINAGRSGALAAEVATRAGGVVPFITLPNDELPDTLVPLEVIVNSHGAWSTMTDLEAPVGTIRGIPFRLRYDGVSDSWTITRLTAGPIVPVASPVPFIPATPYSDDEYLRVLWVGRNNYPKATALDPIAAQVDAYRLSRQSFLLLSVCNTTDETVGSPGHTEVLALNEELLAYAPREYVDVRGRLIREGLSLAGLTPTPDDVTDIANDCIPRQLLSDGLHTNLAGRLAIAQIVQDELTTRSLLQEA